VDSISPLVCDPGWPGRAKCAAPGFAPAHSPAPCAGSPFGQIFLSDSRVGVGSTGHLDSLAGGSGRGNGSGGGELQAGSGSASRTDPAASRQRQRQQTAAAPADSGTGERSTASGTGRRREPPSRSRPARRAILRLPTIGRTRLVVTQCILRMRRMQYTAPAR
jgi:hypothetical protein